MNPLPALPEPAAARWRPAVALAILASTLSLAVGADKAPPAGFRNPPASARPWVYWFWNNGNVTEEGIEADLAAMKQAGIGGAIVMDVLERFAPPAGDVDYMSAKWQQRMKLALQRPRDLGLELNVTNGPGWCGSSGPWITPEKSMQTLVSSVTSFSGPGKPTAPLSRPNVPEVPRDVFSSSVETEPFYRDVAVLAFPKKSGPVSPDEVRDLTGHMDATGRLDASLPAGEWIIQRIGHASTGSSTRPPVKGGNGLECDKFSADAVTLQFDQVIGRLVAMVPPTKAGGLVATHVDSWEVGNQNWTENFPAEFRKRRGYDLTKYLPNVAFPLPPVHLGGSAIHTDPPEHPVGSPEEVERFRRDFYQTGAELLAEKYIGTLAALSHRHGLRFTMEGYHLPFGDEAEYTAPADEPMTEFWSTGGIENARKAHEMASVGHTMGRRVIGAEAFTASDADQWSLHPALIKSMGDYQFAQGVNRFVIHRYAMQPYLDRFPGATMGPWGLHYERTNTWWPMVGAWHEYLSRCQFMLRQGLFRADALYLRHQRPNQTYFDQNPPLPDGYRSDDISAEQLIARADVRDGRIVLPDGMSYALLVVPGSPMTPDLVRRIADLVERGATVYGPAPTASPSLSDYPACDQAVADLAKKVWGDGATEHAFGRGRVINGEPFDATLKRLTGGPDFRSTVPLNWIHRTDGPREIYFVANPKDHPVIADVEFRVKGGNPQWWNPETGEARPLALVTATGPTTHVTLPLARGQSGFVVFEPGDPARDFVATVTRNGEPVGRTLPLPEISIVRATYGPADDAARTIDARPLLEEQLRRGNFAFLVSRLAEPEDPAYGVVKTLRLEATINGEPFRWSGVDTESLDFLGGGKMPEAGTTVWGTPDPQTVVLSTREDGEFRVTAASGKTATVTLPKTPEVPLRGPWTVSFPPNWGAPDRIELDELASLSDSPIEGVRHFSGVATYRTTFDFPAGPAGLPGTARHWLNLGDLEVMGAVTLNGKKLGVAWNRPARIEVTDALRPGRNELVVEVANSWANRMIGDAKLPESQRFTWSSYQPFKPDSPLPKSGLLGPVVLETRREVRLPLTAVDAAITAKARGNGS